MVIGDTFQLAGGHLWIAITAPDGLEGHFVVVNLTTLRPPTADQTCVLHDGDHPFVHHDSVIQYSDAREWWIEGANGYDEHLNAGNVTPNQHMSNVILRRVQDGALHSPYFAKKYLARVQACLVAVG